MKSIFSETMADMNWLEIEEHGPHLPLATDIYLSYAVCRKRYLWDTQEIHQNTRTIDRV